MDAGVLPIPVAHVTDGLDAVVGVLINESLEVDVDADAIGGFPFIRTEMLLKIISPVLIGENPIL